MTYLLKLIFRNLFRQKLRTALTLLGIVIAITAFTLLRTLVGAWYGGVDASSSSRLITRHAVSLTFSLPVSYRTKIRQVDGVTQVSMASWFAGIYIDEKHFFPQFAIDAPTYFELFPELSCPTDQLKAFYHDRKGAVVGRKVAQEYGWKLGDVVPLRGTIYPGNWGFVVRCIYRGTRKGVDETQFFFHYDNLNETLRKSGGEQVDKTGIFVVGVDDPTRAAEISGEIDRLFRNSLAETLTETEKAFQLSFVAMTEAIVVAIEIVSFVVIVIIMAVMANTMTMTGRERIGEYATLKALGFGPGFLATLIGGESLLISLLAGGLGIVVSFPIVEVMADKLGTLFPVFILAPATLWQALGASTLVGLVAAVFPAWRATSVSVVEGLRNIG